MNVNLTARESGGALKIYMLERKREEARERHTMALLRLRLPELFYIHDYCDYFTPFRSALHSRLKLEYVIPLRRRRCSKWDIQLEDFCLSTNWMGMASSALLRFERIKASA